MGVLSKVHSGFLNLPPNSVFSVQMSDSSDVEESQTAPPVLDPTVATNIHGAIKSAILASLVAQNGTQSNKLPGFIKRRVFPKRRLTRFNRPLRPARRYSRRSYRRSKPSFRRPFFARNSRGRRSFRRTYRRRF